jgi:hypothetical protein
MTRVLRFLSDHARGHEPGSLDSPETEFVSLAAMEERAQPIYAAPPPRHREVRRIGRRRDSGACPDARRFNTLYEITYSFLLFLPESISLTQSNHRGTDPYARWCGRGGVARRPSIPISRPKHIVANREVNSALLSRSYVQVVSVRRHRSDAIKVVDLERPMLRADECRRRNALLLFRRA